MQAGCLQDGARDRMLSWGAFARFYASFPLSKCNRMLVTAISLIGHTHDGHFIAQQQQYRWANLQSLVD